MPRGIASQETQTKPRCAFSTTVDEDDVSSSGPGTRVPNQQSKSGPDGNRGRRGGVVTTEIEGVMDHDGRIFSGHEQDVGRPTLAHLRVRVPENAVGKLLTAFEEAVVIEISLGKISFAPVESEAVDVTHEARKVNR